MKVNKKGVLGISALIATSALILTGCAGGGGDAGSTAPADGGSLTVWVDADRATVLKDAAKAFQDETGVKVTLVQKDFGEIRDQFISQVPTGKGPDIAVGAHDWLGTLVTNGVVAPVELGDAAGDFQKVAIDAMSYEGKTYGVPYSIENIALMRNTALAPEAPATYDDMIAAGTAAGTEYKFLVGLDPEQGDPYHLYPFQTSFGAPGCWRTLRSLKGFREARTRRDRRRGRARPAASFRGGEVSGVTGGWSVRSWAYASGREWAWPGCGAVQSIVQRSKDAGAGAVAGGRDRGCPDR